MGERKNYLPEPETPPAFSHESITSIKAFSISPLLIPASRWGQIVLVSSFIRFVFMLLICWLFGEMQEVFAKISH